MGRIEVSSDQKSVTIEAGARWRDVYAALEPRNLTVLGGRVADVGVGGLLLGGKLDRLLAFS
jgi:FAD/FMN-containing dehydrogenase